MNEIICQDSRDLSIVPSDSVHLIITSPPYNVGKDYEKDQTLSDWKELLRDVFAECYRVLIPGGRICINIAGTWRKPYLPLHKYIMDIIEEFAFNMRGEIIWDKAASAGVSTAWGSWNKASNPVLRDVHEYILVYSKGAWGREEGKSTIVTDEFLSYTKSIWTFPTTSAKRSGHPAPFPLELPTRLIKLYSYEGDIVLDPFAGTGTTCIAAMKEKRRYLGFDNHPGYVKKAVKRLDEARKEPPSLKEIARDQYGEEGAKRVRDFEYMVALRQEDKPKTSVWLILTQKLFDKLGVVKWHAPWRQYAFHIGPLVFSRGCLRDLADFIDNLMTERKVERKRK